MFVYTLGDIIAVTAILGALIFVGIVIIICWIKDKFK